VHTNKTDTSEKEIKMNQTQRDKETRSLEATERIARIEDPQGNEVDDRITEDRKPIDRVRLDMINMD